MVLRITGDANLAAICQNFSPFRYRLFRVVGALRVNRGAQNFKHMRHIGLIEENNMIDAP